MKESIYNARENNIDVKWIVTKKTNAEIVSNNLNEVLIWDVSQ